LVEAPDVGWGDPQTILTLAGSAVLVLAFVLIEARQRAPLVPLRMFRSRTLVGANAVMLVFGTLPYGFSFVLTLYAQEVLGYSALKFGLTSLVFPATAAVGSIVGQGLVFRIGFRPVATVGMVLMGAGSLILTQASPDGTYFGDIFFGLLVFGPGVGLTFVTASIAALAGIPEHESGLASGLSNTSFQIGAALGVAIVSTIAVSRTEDYVAANPDASPLVGLTEGFQSAFLGCVVLAAIGVVLSLTLLGRRGRFQEELEAVPTPAE
jgi:MFS family permease